MENKQLFSDPKREEEAEKIVAPKIGKTEK